MLHTSTPALNTLLGIPAHRIFTEYELDAIRTVSIVANSVSLCAGLFSFLMLWRIDSRRFLFRHHLLTLLLSFDFLKSLVLIIHPLIFFKSANRSIFISPGYYQTMGWLTAFFIEGGDIIILLFAIHFYLVVLQGWKWENPRTGNKEGGLYKVRRYMYVVIFVVPAVFASLGFIDIHTPSLINGPVDSKLATIGGYKPQSYWCYLPVYPIWFRLALSWIPRYIVGLTIFYCYGSIFLHVVKQSRQIHNELSHHTDVAETRIGKFKEGVLEFFYPSKNEREASPDFEPVERSIRRLQYSVRRDTFQDFQFRKTLIRKQTSYVFIYPMAYLFLWFFPFWLQNHEMLHKYKSPPLWLVSMAALSQTSVCTIDSLVFWFREKPWNYAWHNVQYEQLLSDYKYQGYLDKDTIQQFLDSDAGRRGWYYTPCSQVSLFWQLVHKLPLFKGVNLYQLDRQLRISNNMSLEVSDTMCTSSSTCPIHPQSFVGASEQPCNTTLDTEMSEFTGKTVTLGVKTQLKQQREDLDLIQFLKS